MKRTAAIVTAICLLAIGIYFSRRTTDRHMLSSTKKTHVILIGASIGRAWQVEQWPTRVNASAFSAESLAAWQFDKSEAVDEVLMRPSRKFRPTRTYLKSMFQPPPQKADIVILKECSSYFPGDLALYQHSIGKWIARLQSKRIKVVLATVVPVTLTRSQQDPGKQDGLLEYNQWVRQYALQHGLEVLDLEAALRRNDTDKYLREEFATSDGSHLNSAAYSVLDRVLLKTVTTTSTVDSTPPSDLVPQ